MVKIKSVNVYKGLRPLLGIVKTKKTFWNKMTHGKLEQPMEALGFNCVIKK